MLTIKMVEVGSTVLGSLILLCWCSIGKGYITWNNAHEGHQVGNAMSLDG